MLFSIEFIQKFIVQHLIYLVRFGGSGSEQWASISPIQWVAKEQLRVCQPHENVWLGSGWWFGTFVIFHFISGMSSQPHWRTPSFFRGVGLPPTSTRIILPSYYSYYYYHYHIAILPSLLSYYHHYYNYHITIITIIITVIVIMKVIMVV